MISYLVFAILWGWAGQQYFYLVYLGVKRRSNAVSAGKQIIAHRTFIVTTVAFVLFTVLAIGGGLI
jgi:hypothetical protein